MAAATGVGDPLATMSFQGFWQWVTRHPNCILRAGTPDTVLVDDEDLHWHFAGDGPTLFVQVLRGKRLLGEIVVDPERVAYVQSYTEAHEGEFGFELISEDEQGRVAAYFFVLSHGWDDEDPAGPSRVLH